MTNGLAFLPQVDEILVMKNGHVSERGSYEQLVARSGAFADFLKEFGGENDDSDGAPAAGDSRDSPLAPINRAISAMSSTSRQESRSMSRQQSEKHEDKGAASGRLMEEEEVAEGAVKWSVFWSYASAVPLLLLAVLLLLASQVLDAGSKYWISLWSQDAAAGNGTAPFDEGLRNTRLSVYGTLVL